MGCDDSRAPPPKVRRARRVGPDYVRARAGELPAEALTQVDRWRLVAEFHRLGWSDEDIATHTQMTVYTTARIRSSMGLEPNENGAGGGTEK